MAAEPHASPQHPWEENDRRTWMSLYRFIYRRVQNREAAEDLTQESYLRVLAAKRKHSPAVFSGRYLRTVAINLIRDRWRRRKRRGSLSPLEAAWLAAPDNADNILNRIWLTNLLQQLPEEQREVLRLRIVEGLSRAETARRMGRSEASIRGLQYRALQSLRDRVREHAEEVKRR